MPTIQLPHTNQVVDLERNEEGNFICHCTHKDCPRPFKFAKNLRIHILKAGSRWNGPGIKADPTLEQVGLGSAPGRWVHSYVMPGTGVEAGPSKARMDLTHDKGLTPGTSKGVHSFDTIPGAEVEPSPSRASSMDLAQESDSDIDQVSIIKATHGKIMMPISATPVIRALHWNIKEATPSNPMPSQDEIMCSPTPTKSSTTPTVTPQAASPSMWSNMLTQDDVNMGSPMSDKSAPPQQLPPPSPSLLSVMHSHSASTTQGNQLPSTSTSTTPGSHTIGLLHHTYLDSLNLAVNAEFHFLTSQICQAALAPGEFKLAISALKVATDLPSHITGPRPMVRGMAMTASFKAPSHHAKAQFLETLQGDIQALWEVEIVQDEGSSSLHQSLVDSLLKELEPMLQVIQTPLDGCMVAGKDIKQLCSLVALPKNDDGDIPGLKDVVEAYYEEAIPLLDRTWELVLQRLNSPDPTKSGISNTPFHKHLYKSTMKKYILPVVALLAMLIRQEYTGRPFSGSNPKLMDLLAVLHIDGSEGRDALPSLGLEEPEGLVPG
ncbi:hypothetical protein EDC04DRAFT_2899872 [Pisolithus marmoratus]|nr:hypothetical protein EDC04DRAFT_2899872 [Pisolithus marmoratus]